jgi:hypothetical protein
MRRWKSWTWSAPRYGYVIVSDQCLEARSRSQNEHVRGRFIGTPNSIDEDGPA